MPITRDQLRQMILKRLRGQGSSPEVPPGLDVDYHKYLQNPHLLHTANVPADVKERIIEQIKLGGPEAQKQLKLREYLRDLALRKESAFPYYRKEAQVGQGHRDDLAQFARANAMFSDIAAGVGGTRSSPFLGKQADRLTSDAEKRRLELKKKLETPTDKADKTDRFDPRLLGYLKDLAGQESREKIAGLRLKGKEKEKKEKTPGVTDFTDQYGIKWRYQVNPETGMMDKSGPSEISSVPDVNKTRKDLSKEYNDKIEYHEELSRAYQEVKALIAEAREIEKQGGHPGGHDYAIIKRFEKFLDPTSVVREGEFKSVGRIGGALNRFFNTWDSLVHGQILSDPARQALYSAIETMYDLSVSEAVPFINQRFKEITDRLAAAGLNIDFDRDIKAKLAPAPDKGATPAAKTGLTKGRPIGTKIRKKGSNEVWEKIKDGDDRDQSTWRKLKN